MIKRRPALGFQLVLLLALFAVFTTFFKVAKSRARKEVRAAFVILARNSDLNGVRHAMRQLEDRFNEKFNYPYVFLNEEHFTDEFKQKTASLTRAAVHYGKIDADHWGYPDFINQTKAAACRQEMESREVIYGGSESYRHMCRYQSGFFFRHPLLASFEYYWRVEPDVDFYCDIDYDVFQMMKDNDFKYGMCWTMALTEYMETIPTLWNATQQFMSDYPEYVQRGNDSLLSFLTDDDYASYNGCHFWSNFEIGSLDFLRSIKYTRFFEHLDRQGGFFYERWGDAPVHSLAVAMMLKSSEVHFFNDIGYKHIPLMHCPTEPWHQKKCACDEKENFGGFVLWQKAFAPISGSPVQELIKNVLIEERSGTTEYIQNNYALKWTFANEVELVFVVVYQKILTLNYLEELLETVKRVFMATFQEMLGQDVMGDFSSFGPIFDRLLKQVEEKYINLKKQPRKFEDTKKFEQSLKGSQAQNTGSLPLSHSGTNAQIDEDEITKNIRALHLQGNPRGKGVKKSTSVKTNKPSEDTSQKKKKSQKQARVWDGQIAKGEMDAYDYSEKAAADDTNPDLVASQWVDESKLGQKNEKGIYEVQDIVQQQPDDVSEEEDEFDQGEEKKSTGLFSYLKSFTGTRELTADMLDPVISTIREHLVAQNVATEIADHLCQSVKSSLLGKKLGSFERVSTAVRNSMEAALKRILTPKTSLDILRDIEQARSEKRPYSICFIGVNGVGKSTNLSKVCFWLLQNNYKILIAACDTFRSGAVEQLRVHARNLRALQTSGEGQVELFERGYGKDSAGIAKDAIGYAAMHHFDVVLIDTAGRMQDNEPLMRALSKLVSVNQPDKIIFVGEALVGNEAVDQLTKFNQALKDFSGLQNPRHIDGMILTKFDTIDDKVGAALSMTYITGQPIYFVGTGQTYTDLKNLKVSHVVHSLLKK
ncbi:hypothetical protein G6F37_008230 [Rhizopus arrhizus]|nr:hypothetical protein G6F38_009966 [Rhizopus arrhizus]KAG1155774.1 hypothetical protein G6F37_008230 [Rhizopus arrhizus]